MRKASFLAVLLASCLIFAGCGNWHNLASPSAPSRTDYSNLSSWYPCVVVQTPGYRGSREFDTQMSAVRKLHDAGRMDWIRLGDIDSNSTGRDYATEAKSMGMRVFAIMDLIDLDAGPSWESTFDRLYSLHPEVDIWEIGGEISNPAINPKTSTPEAYMAKFKPLVSYVHQKYPNVVLTSAPTLGSGGGPHEFERFIELGLLDMDVIIAVNIYDFSSSGYTLQNYASTFSRYSEQLSRKRIWVTETGTPFRDRQVEYVENFYPQILNSIHPEMICWYVLWDGDNGPSTHGMLNGVSTPPYTESNLFQTLTGGR